MADKYKVVKLEDCLWGVQQKVMFWWVNYAFVEWEPENNFHTIPKKIPVLFDTVIKAQDFVDLLNGKDNDR